MNAVKRMPQPSEIAMGIKNWAWVLFFHMMGISPGKSGKGGEHDGSEAGHTCGSHRIEKGGAFTPFSIDVIDEHQTVVDHHPGETQHAEYTHDTQVLSHDDVSKNRIP